LGINSPKTSSSRKFLSDQYGLSIAYSCASFSYVPYTEDKGDITACGIPQNYNASKEWADKKVILFAVPGQYITQSTFSGGHF
jgi:hypothetical protein